ncbi:MAG: NADPH-dependent F420 reductase [Chloroflexi bacterium]|nr:NADPH-dependent F420 reductase [Chloroflexota bacterium]
MNISIIGTGKVGSTLGKCWAQGGHSITFGSREPGSDRVQTLVQEVGNGANAVSNKEAMAASPMIVLAVPWKAIKGILAEASDMAGKILMDPINIYPQSDEKSCAEQIAGWAKGASVVKAFNMTGTGNMAYPHYGEQKLTMFICGNDSDAKLKVTRLVEEIGFDVIDAGGLDSAFMLESLARLWIHLAYANGMGTDIGFKLLKR